MATFTSKFGIGELVYVTAEASYYKTPTIYKIYSVTFINTTTCYLVERVAGNGDSHSQSILEDMLSSAQE